MVCENIIGKLSDKKFEGLNVQYVDIEWHETFKKIHLKTLENGEEVGIKLDNDILKKGIKKNDVIYADENRVIAVNIPDFDVIYIKVDDNHKHMIAKVCYEIGNRHASLFYGENENEFITPYTAPLFEMLEKLHGVKCTKKHMCPNFEKSISATINNHTH